MSAVRAMSLVVLACAAALPVVAEPVEHVEITCAARDGTRVHISFRTPEYGSYAIADVSRSPAWVDPYDGKPYVVTAGADISPDAYTVSAPKWFTCTINRVNGRMTCNSDRASRPRYGNVPGSADCGKPKS